MYGIIGKNGDSLLRCQVVLDKVVKNSASKNTLVKQYLTSLLKLCNKNMRVKQYLTRLLKLLTKGSVSSSN